MAVEEWIGLTHLCKARAGKNLRFKKNLGFLGFNQGCRDPF